MIQQSGCTEKNMTYASRCVLVDVHCDVTHIFVLTLVQILGTLHDCISQILQVCL